MRSVLVLGLGKSGIAAARHALGAGDELVIYAGASNESTRAAAREFERAGVPVIFDVEEVEGHFDTCVVSPGISERGAFYASAGKASGEVISEPEYAWRMSPRAWVAVTGTNGKTTVTCLVKHVLEQTLGAKVGLIGTIENRIGDTVVPTERTTPESFALQGLLRQMLDAGCTHVVMEVSSHALALHRVDGIPFTVGAFTNLTEDHLDFHKTMEAYGAAKARLFRLCRTGVLNADDPAYRTMLQGATCTPLLVGTGKDAALRAEQVQLAPDHVAMEVREGEKAAHVRIGIPGRFTVSNALLTLGIARALGIGLEDACRALGTAAGVKGRIEVVPTPGRDYTVLIDYAHTPDGLENILRSVRDFCRGRLIVLFGCGGDRDRTKRPIMGEIAARLADVLVVTSDNPRTEEPMAIIREILAGIPQTEKPVYVEENRRRAIRMTLRFAQKDDMIVLAGKGHETYQVLGTEKIHFDEREEVAACLQEEDHEQ